MLQKKSVLPHLEAVGIPIDSWDVDSRCWFNHIYILRDWVQLQAHPQRLARLYLHLHCVPPTAS